MIIISDLITIKLEVEKWANEFRLVIKLICLFFLLKIIIILFYAFYLQKFNPGETNRETTEHDPQNAKKLRAPLMWALGPGQTVRWDPPFISSSSKSCPCENVALVRVFRARRRGGARMGPHTIPRLTGYLTRCTYGLTEWLP